MMVSVFHGRTEIVTYQTVLDRLMMSRNQTVTDIQLWRVIAENRLYEEAERTASNIIKRIQQGAAS